MINYVNGAVQNANAVNALRTSITRISDKYTGTVYFGFALSEIDNEKIIIDVLIVTKEKGILAIKFSTGNKNSDSEQSDKVYILLRNLLMKSKRLRDKRDLAIDINSIIVTLDTTEAGDGIISIDRFNEYFGNLDEFNDEYYEALNEALDKIVSAKPKKLRSNIHKEGSYGSIIKNIERQIANLDEWQKEAAYEIPDRPQRIRGLAGSGKTIVLALKAAYLHFNYPDEDIAVTFYSRSLYEQFKKLINEFYMQYSDGVRADFSKIHLLHAWGSKSELGLYSFVADKLNQQVYSYNEAIMKYGSADAFKGICKELLNNMSVCSPENMRLFDHILIDEAQDLPSEFFKIAIRLFKDQNKKRLVFAYDELQTLNQNTMPSLDEMFGVDSEGNSIVEIGNESENEPKTDIVLPICYRNTKWALSIAHALGFGVYRENVKQPLVQFFEDLDVWKKIGYRVAGGNLDYGKEVTLVRDKSPEYFETLLTSSDAVQVHEPFATKEQEYAWIVNQIKKNIEEDELEPDDILVIFPNAWEAKNHYAAFRKVLIAAGISSIMPSVNVDRDTFSQTGSITCTHIYRAKGNEKPMVYLADAEYGCLQSEIVQARNVLFTAITRSRAWIRISGIGNGMDRIKKEIEKCQRNDYALKINIPPKEEIRALNLLNKGNKNEEQKIKKVENAADALIEALRDSGINTSDIPQINDLIDLLSKKKRTEK